MKAATSTTTRTAARAVHQLPSRHVSSVTSTSTTGTTRRPATATASFSTTATARSSSHSSYDPPTGWLFGVKPGEKYQKEGWEGLMTYGFFGSLGVAAVAYAFKPDTSIQTWALEEARRRLEIEGILEDPDSKKA